MTGIVYDKLKKGRTVPDRRKFRVLPVSHEKKEYPHVSIVFANKEELKAFDDAILEERKATGITKLNRSSIIKRLVNKWVNYEVTL